MLRNCVDRSPDYVGATGRSPLRNSGERGQTRIAPQAAPSGLRHFISEGMRSFRLGQEHVQWALIRHQHESAAVRMIVGANSSKKSYPCMRRRFA